MSRAMSYGGTKGRPHRSTQGTPSKGRTSSQIYIEDPSAKTDKRNPFGFQWVCEDARVGLRGASEYSATPSNPKLGSQHAVTGTVASVHNPGSDDPDHRPVNVAWDNGEHNSYFFKDLFRETSPYKQEKEKAKGKLFNANDIVLLKPGFYPPGNENPCIACAYQCPGVITQADHHQHEVVVTVRWNNGIRNHYTVPYKAEKDVTLSALVNYNDRDALKKIATESPNLAYKLTKRNQRDDYDVLGILRRAADIKDKDEDPMAEFFAGKDTETYEKDVLYDDGTTFPYPEETSSDEDDGDITFDEDEDGITFDNVFNGAKPVNTKGFGELTKDMVREDQFNDRMIARKKGG
jgi:hypothetical protein